jgi:DNA polymerase-3 subunit alpha
MAGFSMGEADTLRKAMGKKKLEVLMPFKERFIEGAQAKGYERKLAADLFDMIVPFADYGFNASHACAYGLVSYQTAYLMAHYPVEYMAAILTSVKDDKDRKPYYLYACRGMGIDVLPPDVNESDVDFAPAPGERRAIRYGLSAVRNVGDGVVRAVVGARQRGGSFTSFTDFCRRVDPGALTKRVLEALIFAGAFESLGYTRGGMVQQVGEQAAWERVSAPILAERKAEAAGQFSLFGGDDEARTIDESVLEGPELDKRLLLSKEKEMLGQFVTDHPLLGVEGVLRAQTTHDIRELEDLGDGDLVTVGGIVGSLARKYTKRGEPYAQFRLEGLAGGAEVVAFPGVYEAVPELFEPDRVLLVTGRIDLRGRELQIRANEVKEPILGPDAPRAVDEALVVDLPATACTPGVLAKLKDVLEAHPGEAQVRLRFLSSDGAMPLSLGAFTVDPGGSLLGELRSLLGTHAARLVREPV